jgi:DNA repair exonuclease SbcCD nuclease subunit
MVSEMVKILVTADWQLGKAFGRLASGAERFREQLFLTAEYIINEISKDFDIILILGDTFDRPDADWNLIERVAELLRSCDKPIHIIPGNHDYWHSSGVLWSLNQELQGSTNVVIHSEQKPYLVESLELTIYPGILKQRMDISDRTSWIPERQASDGLRIGMFHESIEPFGDFDSKVALNHDLDLAFLGDWHGPSKEIENSLLDQPDKKMWYAGSPEAQSKNQSWKGRVLSIDANLGKNPIVAPISVGKLCFYDLNFEFDEDMENPLDQLKDTLSEIQGDAESTYVRLKLTGEAKPELLDELDEYLTSVSTEWPYSEIDKSGLEVILNSTNDDPMMSQIENELHNMSLDSEVLARSMVLLQRYARRCA